MPMGRCEVCSLQPWHQLALTNNNDCRFPGCCQLLMHFPTLIIDWHLARQQCMMPTITDTTLPFLVELHCISFFSLCIDGRLKIQMFYIVFKPCPCWLLFKLYLPVPANLWAVGTVMLWYQKIQTTLSIPVEPMAEIPWIYPHLCLSSKM